MKKLTVATAVLMTCAVLAAYGADKPETSSARSVPADLGSATIYLGVDPVYAPVYVALEKGLFKQAGVNVDIREFPSGADAIQALRAARTGYVYSISGDVPTLRAWSEGGVVGVSQFSRDTKSLSVVGAKTIQTPKDLNGKKVATVMGSSGQILLSNYLEQNGVTATMINLSPGEMPVALVRGEIAGFLWNQPTAAKAFEAAPGSHFLHKGTEGIGANFLIVSTTKRVADMDAKVTEAVLRGIAAGMEYLKSNPSEANQILASKLKVPVDTAQKQLEIFDHFSLAYEKEMIDLLTAESKKGVTLGILKSPVDFSTQFDTKFLEALGSQYVPAK